ncbi:MULTISPECIES: hypothetical protein [unclassified Herbaspirillum]|uniref:hypothetical protein n=1 Tax=unclassified Herbaspirillum TaxID=2624150 RepID=UPI00160DBF42|nr:MULTISPECIES: hypothetical protein [unclassified Herbaspirillum]MBB5393198.1 hypothetical protein [Herbaspirillum sp. SJZ102]
MKMSLPVAASIDARCGIDVRLLMRFAGDLRDVEEKPGQAAMRLWAAPTPALIPV